MSVAQPPAPTPQLGLQSPEPPILARGLERRFRGGAGLGPIDIRVDTGDLVAVMGPNGSGKTTLLLLLAGLLEPQGGRLHWWGRSEPQSAHHHLGVALDGAVEDGALSGRQATTFWCRQWVGDRARARELADQALSRLGLDDVGDRAVGDYSFGMRRRLALAQALAHRPPLALLDEPTAGLDPEGAAVLTTLLRERSEQGGTTLLASNDAAFVAGVADRVILLDEGRVAHAGTPGELLVRCGAARWAEVEADDPAALLERVRGVAGAGACERIPGGVRVRLGEERSLAELVLTADAGAGRLRALRVHDTDLADCFRQLTGHPLDHGLAR